MKAPVNNSHAHPHNLARFLLRIFAPSDARQWTWLRFLGVLAIAASLGCSSTLTTAPFCRVLQETVCPCPPITDQTAFDSDVPAPLVWSEPIPNTLPSLYSNPPLLDFNSTAHEDDITFSSDTIPLFVLPFPKASHDQ